MPQDYKPLPDQWKILQSSRSRRGQPLLWNNVARRFCNVTCDGIILPGSNPGTLFALLLFSSYEVTSGGKVSERMSQREANLLWLRDILEHLKDCQQQLEWT